MRAVLDASPLCYLVLIGEIELLPHLFTEVRVPEAVIHELQHEDAPEAVRNWALNPPVWVIVDGTREGISAGMEKQAGERAAIVLAQAIDADLVVIDEKAARLRRAKSSLDNRGLRSSRRSFHIGIGPIDTRNRPTPTNELPLFAGAFQSNSGPLRWATGLALPVRLWN